MTRTEIPLHRSIIFFQMCDYSKDKYIYIYITDVKKNINLLLPQLTYSKHKKHGWKFSSLEGENQYEYFLNKHNLSPSFLWTSFNRLNHLGFWRLWNHLLLKAASINRCRWSPSARKSHAHHLIYLPTKLRWALRLHLFKILKLIINNKSSFTNLSTTKSIQAWENSCCVLIKTYARGAIKLKPTFKVLLVPNFTSWLTRHILSFSGWAYFQQVLLNHSALNFLGRKMIWQKLEPHPHP